MDPVTHATVGRLLVAGRRGRGVGMAALLGGLSPDLDAVFMPFGWDLYLRVHQIGTHTLVGSAACAVLVATVVHLCAKGSRWTDLAVAAWLGALSHVALDLLSGATVRPLWPASGAVAHYGLIAMAEPLVVAMLGLAAIAFWRWPARRINVAATTLTLLAILLAGKAVGRSEALRLYADATAHDAVREMSMEAAWGTRSRWVAIDRTADRVRRWRIDTTRGTVAREIDVPVAAAGGLFDEAGHAAVARNFFAAHDFPVAIVTDDHGTDVIRWSDLQYCWNPSSPAAAGAAIGAPVRPVDIPFACGLWFGVAMRADGTVARQFVTIGDWNQDRH